LKDIRVLLASDHELVRYGVRGMLEQEEDMQVVGDCSSAEDVLFLAGIVSPNVILMDADIGGIKALRRLQQQQSPCKVIILTLNKDCLAEALEAGAAGYLLEDIDAQELAQAIRKAYHGELVIDERLTSACQTAEEKPEYAPPENVVRDLQLVIPPPFEAAQLIRFIYQVEDKLDATIVQQIGSWKRGIAITIMLRRVTPLPTILDRLRKMPEVEVVIATPAVRHRFFNFPLKSIAEPETRVEGEFLVTLKQADTADN